MTARGVLRNLLPYGVVQILYQRERERQAEGYRTVMARREARRLQADAQLAPTKVKAFDYHRALQFLDSLKIAPFHSRDGSMPLPALEFIERHLDRLDATRPLFGLHIGNFLGVSLAFLTDALLRLNSESRMISIDPNVPHRGIEHPANVALALLSEFGLENRVAVLQGYSLEKNLSNDGEVFDGYDPVANWQAERACTEQLPLLKLLGPARFDLCLIDGNHDAPYLRRELDEVQGLLAPGGLLILDDVADPWPEIQAVFAEIEAGRFAKLAANGRIGILVKR